MVIFDKEVKEVVTVIFQEEVKEVDTVIIYKGKEVDTEVDNDNKEEETEEKKTVTLWPLFKPTKITLSREMLTGVFQVGTINK